MAIFVIEARRAEAVGLRALVETMQADGVEGIRRAGDFYLLWISPSTAWGGRSVRVPSLARWSDAGLPIVEQWPNADDQRIDVDLMSVAEAWCRKGGLSEAA